MEFSTNPFYEVSTMQIIVSSRMRCVSFILAFLVFPAVRMHAQMTTDAEMTALFSRVDTIIRGDGQKILPLDSLCDVASCHNAVTALSVKLEEGKHLHAEQQLLGGIKSQWHSDFGDLIQQTSVELYNVRQRKLGLKPIVLNVPFSSNQPHLTKVDQAGCTEVLEVSLAICSAYAVAGPTGQIASAICVLATTYGYNKCIARAKAAGL